MSDDNMPTKVPAVCRDDHANGKFLAAWKSSDNLRLSTLRRMAISRSTLRVRD
jgi:hypothetical protein